MKKKIAFITSSLTAGGAERNIINLGLSLPKDTYTTDIISITPTNEYLEEYGKRLKKLRIFYLFTHKTLTNAVLKYICSPVVIINLLLLVRKNRYSLIIAAHEYNTFYITVACAKILRIGSILIIGNNLKSDLETKSFISRLFHGYFLTVSLRLCDRIICVSRGVLTQIKVTYSIPDSKISTIHNGVDGKQIKQKVRIFSKEIPHKPRSIVIAGRIVRRKGYAHILKAINYLKNEKKFALSLLIIGNGQESTELKNLISTFKIENSVEIIGSGGEKLYSHLSSADAFVFSSRYEGFGNTIIEAMSCGLPIISTDCRFGPREILDASSDYSKSIKGIYKAKYGILTPRFGGNGGNKKRLSLQEKKMAHAIMLVLNGPKLRDYYKNKSLERAKFFSIEKMSRQYNKVILTQL